MLRDCHNFASKLIVEINFAKSNLKEIISTSMGSYGGDFKKVLQAYLNYLTSDAKLLKEGELFEKNTFLTADEMQTIFLFFKGLGRYDAENQVKEIEEFKLKFDEMRLQADYENKKYGGLYVKLGLMFGIMLAILLI